MLIRAQVRDTSFNLLFLALKAAGASISRDDAPAQKDTGVTDGALQDDDASVSKSDDTPLQGDGATLAIVLYVSDSKQGTASAGSVPQFRTKISLEIKVRAKGDSKSAAETLLDTACELIENRLLGNTAFVDLFEAIDSVETMADYDGENGKKHFFSADMTIIGHTNEHFEPTIPDMLERMKVYLGSSFDPADDPNFQFTLPTE